MTLSRAMLLAATVAAGGCYTPPPGLGGGRKITSNVEDWRDEVIYQVVVDRFANGDYSNDHGVDRHNLGKYQGGDWRGLIDRIPYFKDLGVTALWISPVVKNVEEDAGFAGYHGYWTQDFLRVNPHFGDLGQLQETVDELHAAGLKVILDIVTNHIGQLFYYDMNKNGEPNDILFGGGGASYGSSNRDVPGNLTRTSEWDPDYDSRGVQSFTSLGESGPAPIRWVYQPRINRVPISPEEFQDPAWYHARGRVTVWENKAGAAQRHADCKQPWEGGKGDLCAYIREQEQLGDFPGGLKDLATELPEVRKGLVRVFQRWIEVADFDGFRIDTLKHVEHEFWRTFCPAMREHAKSLGKQRFFMFGEAFSGYDELLGSYTAPGEVDSVFYFSQMYRLRDVFNRGQATSNLAQLHQDRLKHYSAQPHPDGVGVPPRDALVNFLDNHDVSRFLSEGTPESLRVALTYLTTTVGLPSIYYGTEQELAGGNDPGNREVMWRGNPDRQLAPYDRSNPTFRHLKALLALRKEHAPLRRGDFTVRWSTTATGAEPDAGIFAYERRHENESVLVVLNAAKCAPGRTHSRTVGGQGQLMQSSFKPGTALANVLSDDDAGDSFVVGPAGVEVKVPCQGAKILVAK